jgi:hypothetical protein
MAQDRRDQIAETAFECLADKGFEGCDLRLLVLQQRSVAEVVVRN